LRRSIADVAVLDTRYDDAERDYAALRADSITREGSESDAVLDSELAQAHLELQRGHSEEAAKGLEALLQRLRQRKGEHAE
jgi:hypothetical protein